MDTDTYLLHCCRYVELNPIKAGIVEAPEDYPWSSCATRLGAAHLDWLTEPPTYADLAATTPARIQAYRQFLGASPNTYRDQVIKQAIQRNQLTGGINFVAEVERRTGMRIEARPAGRPRGKL